jgi:hypothetical protein
MAAWNDLPEPTPMSLSRSVAEILDEHTTLELECIDRMYLNLYVPILQSEAGCAYFWTKHRGNRFASSVQMGPMSHAFVRSIERFAEQEGIAIVKFRKGQRKDEVAQEYLQRFEGEEGVLFIGKAQEKARVVRTETRRNPETGATYPWLMMSTAMVNHYYFYCVDRDFGPFFIKFCSYFPYNAKLLLNGHEYAKRQLAQRGIPYEALDNGILSCADPSRLQRLCAGLSDQKIDVLARRWFRRLPHPFPPEDRRAGFRYDLSILQAEFSLTQVLDRPLAGRRFFEQVIRENLDLGRPSQVQLIFDRRVIRTTPGRFRTRVITEGVIPSLHVDYKHSKIKQYHKEGRALRTETTINDAYDFEIGRKLKNLSALRKVGFQANRRLLRVQRISHDAMLGEGAFTGVQQPALVEGQRASGLRFADPRVLALLASLLLFRLLPRGFSHHDLRGHMASLLGLDSGGFTQNQMSYDLRRLRLHGLIERIPRSHRYHVTDFGFRSALFLTRAYNRLLCPGTAIIHDAAPPADTKLHRAFCRVDREVERIWKENRLAA